MKAGGKRELIVVPQLAYGFLSDFARLGIDGWSRVDTVGHPQGHFDLEGYMSPTD